MAYLFLGVRVDICEYKALLFLILTSVFRCLVTDTWTSKFGLMMSSVSSSTVKYCYCFRIRSFIGIGVGAGANVLSRFAVCDSSWCINSRWYSVIESISYQQMEI